MNKSFDIIIVGAGVVGLTQAIAASQLGYDVAVIDRSGISAKPISKAYDARVYAINRASEDYWRSLGVWEQIQRQHAYHSMIVWDGSGDGEIHFAAREVGQVNLGHIIEDNAIKAALLAVIVADSRIHCFANTELTHFSRVNHNAILGAADGQLWQAPLVIAADGGRSWLREQAGIEMTQRPYGHTAIVSTVTMKGVHQDTAWQCFTPTGPLAFLPLDNVNQCSIVWSQEDPRAAELMALADDEFCHALTQVMSKHLGEVLETTPRFTFPLQEQHAQTYVQENVVLVGDAAHTFHPLAGQGANCGMLDVMALSQQLQRAGRRHARLADVNFWQSYATQRRGHNASVMMAMRGLKTVFSGDSGAKSWLRSWGLRAANRINPLKTFFVEHALGYRL